MSSSSPKVLYIEDDKFEQMAFETLLKSRKLPYRYTIAGSVAQAKEALSRESFDVVLADYSLGDGTAFDLFPFVRDSPIIVVTATGDQEVAVRAMKAGAFDYLIKDPDKNFLSVLPLTIEKAMDWKRTDRQLRLLSHALMKTSDSVVIADADNRISFVNSAFERMYGYSGKEILGENSTVLGDTCTEGEFVHRRKGGQEIPVSLSRSVITDEKGSAAAIVLIARDVTERKRAEAEREKLISELREALANVKTLSGLLPICSWCKKVRNDKGYWQQVEMYIQDHTEAEFSHGVCPDCLVKFREEPTKLPHT